MCSPSRGIDSNSQVSDVYRRRYGFQLQMIILRFKLKEEREGEGEGEGGAARSVQMRETLLLPVPIERTFCLRVFSVVSETMVEEYV